MVRKRSSTAKGADQGMMIQSTTTVHRHNWTHNDYRALTTTTTTTSGVQTLLTSSWQSSRRNSTSIVTWREPGGSRLPQHCHSMRHKWRFGFRTDAWSRRSACVRVSSWYKTSTTNRISIPPTAHRPILTAVPLRSLINGHYTAPIVDCLDICTD